MESPLQESFTPPSWSHAALSLNRIGGGFLSRNDFNEALESFEAALAVLSLPKSRQAWSIAVNCLHIGKNALESSQANAADENDLTTVYSPDLYEDDECDVGPRIMQQPIISADFSSGMDSSLLEAIILFNKGLVYHKTGNLPEAKAHYEVVAYTVQTMLSLTFGSPSTSFLLLAMRSHNNLGLISYLERKEGVAAASFEAAIQFGRLLAPTSKCSQMEYIIALSNWCRVNWMRGDIGDSLYSSVKEILCIRMAWLPWNHVDIAAAHYNVAVAEYARQNRNEAVAHLLQYLVLAKHRSDDNQNGLSPIPALIFLLLIQNEDKNDSTSQDLVRGLRALQEKRQDLGPNSLEVASVLNYVGTLLFHQADFENALVFFREELRLEDMKEIVPTQIEESCCTDETTSISVTCNNIGRILQELGKYKDAISYYYRALKPEYGDVGGTVLAPYKVASVTTKWMCDKYYDASYSTSSANLYSTVWYNLGLIHDKLGAYGEAITAFEMSLRLRKVLLGDTHSDIACLLYNIGVLQMEQQRLDDASASFREALSIRRVTSAGRLNDRHVIKTLGKLAALHRDKGNLQGALEIAREIMSIQDLTPEYDVITRLKEVGATLRFIAELHHTEGTMDTAVSYSLACAKKLRTAADLIVEQQGLCLDPNLQPLLVRDRIANVEQLVLTLLLLGSLYYESGEPLQAEVILQEASTIIEDAFAASMMYRYPVNTTLTSIHALYEVTKMLGTCRCAPMA